MPPIATKAKTGLAAKVVGCKVGHRPNEPLWKGPREEGVTQSLISRAICCPYRFYVRVMEGLAPPPKFSHRLEYGSMWHVCEEHFAKGEKWEEPLLEYCKKLSLKYPMDRTDILKWFQVCRHQFPIYVEYWKKHPDILDRQPLLQEKVFDVPYNLPSGRVCKLKGKFDSVDLVGKGKTAGITLVENKSKGEVNIEQIKRQLQFDLQTSVYIVALEEYRKVHGTGNEVIITNGKKTEVSPPIVGIRYNVVRRPLSGGKGNIKRNELKESEEDYYKRLQQYFIDEPADWFNRWNVEISRKDIEKFKEQFLDPVLENLCDDYEWWVWCMKEGQSIFNYRMREVNFPAHRARTWRLPYGTFNVLTEGSGSSDVDEYIDNNSEVGLSRGVPLFQELQEG